MVARLSFRILTKLNRIRIMTNATENEQIGLTSQLDHLKNVVEHPELVPDRLVCLANMSGAKT
jgi:hypothetical protein